MIVENVVPEDLAKMSREQGRRAPAQAPATVSAAAEYGVTVMVEDFPSPLLPMCDSAEMRAAGRRAGPQLVLDTGNTLARKEGPRRLCGAVPLGDFVHVHLKDIEYPGERDHRRRGRGRAPRNGTPSTGRASWTLQKAPAHDRETGYKGFVTVGTARTRGTRPTLRKMAESPLSGRDCCGDTKKIRLWKVEKLADGVLVAALARRLPDASFTWSRGAERALLIDTGFGVGDLKALCERLTDKPLLVVDTHSHGGPRARQPAV